MSTGQSWKNQLRGFYAVLDRPDWQLARQLVSPDQAGAGIVQLRLKLGERTLSVREILSIAKTLRALTYTTHTLMIVNDRIDIALAVGADGVHLGQADVPIGPARRIARQAGRSAFLIGCSTHNEKQVEHAVAQGADYVGFGPIYATQTKRDADAVVGLDGLSRAVKRAGSVPVVAIGGITPARASQVAASGAHAACCIRAVNEAPNPREAGRRISMVFRGKK